MDWRLGTPGVAGGYSRQPLTGFMWIGVYDIPRHDVSTEKANAVALRFLESEVKRPPTHSYLSTRSRDMAFFGI